MPTLLVQSCSATKNDVTKPTQAIEVYDGYFFRIIKKAIREGAFRSDIELRILSAEHGILHADDEITNYDRRMTPSRASELHDYVTEDLRHCISNGDYETVIINMGSVYTQAVGNISNGNNADITYVKGDGIGTKGRKLKQVVRNDMGSEVTA